MTLYVGFIKAYNILLPQNIEHTKDHTIWRLKSRSWLGADSIIWRC